MASQNERYQKMLMDKMSLLGHEKTVVQDHVSSLMKEVDKATESCEKFMKISLTSKKFMKRFQEANSAMDTALTTLIKVSNLFASLNDESNSSSESDSPSETEGSKQTVVPVQETTTVADHTHKNAEKVDGNASASKSAYRAVDEPRMTEEKLDENADKVQRELISKVQSYLAGVEEANIGQPRQRPEPSPPTQKQFSQNQLNHTQAAPSSNVNLRRPNNSSVSGPPRARTLSNISGSTGKSCQTPIAVDTQTLPSIHSINALQGPLSHRTNQQSVSSGSPPFSSIPSSPNPSVTSLGWSEGGAIQPLLRTTSLSSLRPGDKLEVMISHVVSPSMFWIQDTQSGVVQLMTDIRNFYSQQNVNIPIPNPNRGLICCAQFSQDLCWYRAQITGVHHPHPANAARGILVDVFYIDYGNSETISAYSIRSLHRKFFETPPQAVCCSLAEVIPTHKNGQWLETETSFFTAVTFEKALEAVVVQPKPQPGCPFPTISLSFSERKELEEGVFSLQVDGAMYERAIMKASDASDAVGPVSHITFRLIQINVAELLVAKRLAKSTKVQTSAPSAGPVTAPVTIPPAVPVTGPMATPSTMPVANPSAVPVSGPMTTPSAVPVNSPSAVPQTGSMPTPSTVPVTNPLTAPVTVSTTVPVSAPMTIPTIPMTTPMTVSTEKKNKDVSGGSTAKNDGIVTDTVVQKEAEGDNASVKSKSSFKSNTSGKSKSMTCSDLDGCSTSEQDPSSKAKRWKREIHLLEELPVTNGKLLVAMSYIVHPNEFYVHLITPDAIEIDKLTQGLQEFYNKAENHAKLEDTRTLGVGDFCCAKFERDKSWYRGKILEIKSLGPKGGRKWDFMVFYVDYGNTEWVLETNVKPLADTFYDLPAQALKCSLAHIHPRPPVNKKSTEAKWSDHAIKTLTRLTDFQTRLHGFIVKRPEDRSKAVELNLSIITSDMEVYINQELVNLDLATSDILKNENEEDKELEIASAKWLKHHYSEGGYMDSDEGHPESPTSLMDILEKLDPMAIHFNAEINSYGFDRDDPEMATMGYKSTLDKKVCYYHVSGKGCYRGDNCKYEHPDPVVVTDGDCCSEPSKRKMTGRHLPKCQMFHAVHQWLGLSCPKKNSGVKRVDVRETVECFCTNNVVELLPEESIVCVMVTAVYSPIHFWVQFTFGPRPLDQLKIDCSKSLERPWEDGETLESLNESMNEICKKNNPKTHDMILPAQGEIVLARYSKDKRWYRSRVTFVDEEKIEVFHVDYGTSEWVSKKDLHPALPQFLHLPFQAVQCRLDGLEDSQEIKEEKLNARKYFEQVATGRPVLAHVMARNCDNLLYVELYNTSSEEDIFINQELVKKGFYKATVKEEKNG